MTHQVTQHLSSSTTLIYTLIVPLPFLSFPPNPFLSICQDSNLDDGGRRRLLLRGKTANDVPLSSWNLGGSNSRNQRISNRKNGIRNYLSGFQGLVSNTFSAGGHILNTFSGLTLKSSQPSLLATTETPTSSPSAPPSIAVNVTNSTSHHKYIRTYDFEFAYDVGILALTDEILDTHKFEIVDVTLSGEQKTIKYRRMQYSALRSAEHCRTEQNRTEQNRTLQNGTEQYSTVQHNAEQN